MYITSHFPVTTRKSQKVKSEITNIIRSTGPTFQHRLHTRFIRPMRAKTLPGSMVAKTMGRTGYGPKHLTPIPSCIPCYVYIMTPLTFQHLYLGVAMCNIYIYIYIILYIYIYIYIYISYRGSS